MIVQWLVLRVVATKTQVQIFYIDTQKEDIAHIWVITDYKILMS